MNKLEFLKELEAGLTGLSPDERVSALQYYTEYLDEAGPEREAEVLAELGSPQQVAADVRAASGEEEGWTPPNLNGDKNKAEPAGTVPVLELNPMPALTETPEEPEERQEPQTTAAYQPQPDAGSYAPGYGAGYGNYAPGGSAGAAAAPTQNSGHSTLWIVLLVLLFPLWIGLAGAVFGLLIALLVLLLVPFIIAISFVAAGVLSVVMGIWLVPAAVGSWLLAMGTGLVVAGLGLLAGYAGVMLCAKVVPGMFKWVSRRLQNLFHFGRR